MSLRRSQTMEEPTLSLSKQKQLKLKDFREYLVNKDVLLGYVKCNIYAFLKFSIFSSVGS